MGARVGAVIMCTLVGMALGGWMSGWIFDATGSYRAAFLNGIAWNLLNVAIVVFLLWRAGGVPRLRLRATALSRLCSNLIDNALAYGAPPVEVTTARVGAGVVIDVADRGPGIAAADGARLKQPFTRATDSRARGDGAAGAGLGLAIVDRIARLHGGSFDLLARDGGGTIARVFLPLGL
jgi:signal transduction histidine kinase